MTQPNVININDRDHDIPEVMKGQPAWVFVNNAVSDIPSFPVKSPKLLGGKIGVVFHRQAP